MGLLHQPLFVLRLGDSMELSHFLTATEQTATAAGEHFLRCWPPSRYRSSYVTERQQDGQWLTYAIRFPAED